MNTYKLSRIKDGAYKGALLLWNSTKTSKVLFPDGSIVHVHQIFLPSQVEQVALCDQPSTVVERVVQKQLDGVDQRALDLGRRVIAQARRTKEAAQRKLTAQRALDAVARQADQESELIGKLIVEASGELPAATPPAQPLGIDAAPPRFIGKIAAPPPPPGFRF